MTTNFHFPNRLIIQTVHKCYVLPVKDETEARVIIKQLLDSKQLMEVTSSACNLPLIIHGGDIRALQYVLGDLTDSGIDDVLKSKET